MLIIADYAKRTIPSPLTSRSSAFSYCSSNKYTQLRSGRFGRFWLLQAEYTSIILKREQFSVTPPVDCCVQLFLRLVFIKVRFHQTQEVFFRQSMPGCRFQRLHDLAQ